MIGRALRGQRFGGTEKAYIVSFVDNWKHLINWAGYTLADGETTDVATVFVRRPPVHLISIALVRDLARKMDQGLLINIDPYSSLLPVGWYRTDYLARVDGTDDLETIIQMVMVFDHEQAAYRSWIESCATADLQPFADEQVQLADQWATIEDWRAQFFAETGEGFGDEISLNLFHIARHMATHEGKAPTFFVFDERDHHDLDQIAARLIEQPLLPRDKFATLEAEYRRSDRYWSVFYPNIGFFKSQYDACENRLLLGDSLPSSTSYHTPETLSDREPSQQMKDQVRQRDGYRCLSCGEDTRSWLQIDHVAPSYLGGGNSLANLQTLCKVCNNHKGISEINFRHNETLLPAPPAQFPTLEPPTVELAANPEAWRRFLRRSVNFFYRCAAVADIAVDDAPEATWSIRLWASNDPHWLEPFLGILLQQIQARRFEGGASRPATLTVSAPDHEALSVTAAAPISQKTLAPTLPDLVIATTRQLRIVSTATLPLAQPGQRLSPLATDRHMEEHVAAALIVCEQPLLAVTNVGRAYILAIGSANVPPDLPSLRSGEQIRLLSTVPDDRGSLAAVVLTSAGQIKRRFLNGLLPSTVRGHLITATGAEIIGIEYASAAADLLLVTAWGYAIRFAAKDVPMQEDNAAGVHAVRLGDGESIVALVVVEPEQAGSDLVVITADGYAKRTPLSEYRTQGRGGIGVHTSSVGGVISAFIATAEDEIILLSKKGKAARFAVTHIPQQGRATVGNHLVTIDSDDHLISALALPGNRR
ncbi:MAG: DNA gyrase C-terminal beta-propeller domain-containing protein, partial [Chloroflexales bacterium]